MKTKMQMKDVEFVKGYEYFMGGNRTFWRADYKGRTIATMCSTKKECLDEVRVYIKKHNRNI